MTKCLASDDLLFLCLVSCFVSFVVEGNELTFTGIIGIGCFLGLRVHQKDAT